MELPSQFWAQVARRLEERLIALKGKSFRELAAMPESSSDVEEAIEGHDVLYSAMFWHRDADTVIVVARASVNISWLKTHDYEVGFIMSSRGEVRTATEEEVRSLW